MTKPTSIEEIEELLKNSNLSKKERRRLYKLSYKLRNPDKFKEQRANYRKKRSLDTSKAEKDRTYQREYR